MRRASQTAKAEAVVKEPSGLRGRRLLEQVRGDFRGLETKYPTADGGLRRRTYLDSAASSLMMGAAYRVGESFLEHYSSTHSLLHYGARIASDVYGWSHKKVLSFTGADSDRYTCFFTGSGSTAGFNYVARLLAARRPLRDLVLVSDMEHHSNDLPHRKHAGQVIHVPVQGEPPGLGAVNMEALERALKASRGRTNYVAVSAASNVTGIINPIHDIAEVAHREGAWVVVDASQLVGHAPLTICEPNRPERDLDFVVFSGHKVYAPGSPGVVIGPRSILADLEPDDIGGGTVDAVYLDRYEITASLPERHEAGTPNLVGAVTLCAALEILDRIGPDLIHEASNEIVRRALDGLRQIDGVTAYGCTDLRQAPRTGIVSFTLEGIEHALAAAVLNDYHNVAVRNGCFCAQPYVRRMLKYEKWDDDLGSNKSREGEGLGSAQFRMGMVRASFGLYSTAGDVDALIKGVRDIVARQEYYSSFYREDVHGNFRHENFFVTSRVLFDPLVALEECLYLARNE